MADIKITLHTEEGEYTAIVHSWQLERRTKPDITDYVNAADLVPITIGNDTFVKVCRRSDMVLLNTRLIRYIKVDQ